MSNEYKDWIWDKIQEVVLDAGVADRTTNVVSNPRFDSYFVEGYKNDERVRVEVWLDESGEWRIERRELVLTETP